MTDSTDLAVHTTVTELVRCYDAAEADVRRAFATLANVEAVLGLRVEGRGGWRDHIDWTDPDSTVTALRRQTWRTIVDKLGIRRALSIGAADRLDAHLDGKLLDDDGKSVPLPDITVENVESFAQHYAGKLDELIAEAIREVFDWLRPRIETRAAEYKTNDRVEIGRRVVLPWMVERNWGSKPGYHVKHDRQAKLTALENVFRSLDGRGQQTPHHYSDLANAIEASADGRGETELFRFRACKNRNLHLEFRRLDLLKRFNEVAGGARLKPHETGEAGLVVRRSA